MGLGASDHFASRVGVQGVGGAHAEIVLDGEQPFHGIVAGESAIEQNLDEPGEVLGDAEIVEEDLWHGGLTVARDREQTVIADQRAHPIPGDAQTIGDVIEGVNGDVGWHDVTRQRQ